MLSYMPSGLNFPRWTVSVFFLENATSPNPSFTQLPEVASVELRSHVSCPAWRVHCVLMKPHHCWVQRAQQPSGPAYQEPWNLVLCVEIDSKRYTGKVNVDLLCTY